MKRKLTQTTSVVLVLLVLMGCFFISPSVGAATYGDWEYTLQDDFTCIITKYKGSAKNVTVPSTIYGNQVVSIASAFIDNKSIQTVTISKGIRKIDRYHIYGGTFDGCSNLKSVIIPNTVESIGYWTFRGCSSLESITIPGSVNTIEGYAFEGCTKLKTINFNEGLKEIQEHAFGNCHSLTHLVLPNTLERIGGLAFVGCSGLQTISIGSNLSYIPDDNNAFMPWNGYTGTSSLVSITVNANNGYFCSENGILYNKNKTKLVLYPQAKNDKVYVMPSTVSEIVSNSLIYNPYMSEISIPKNIKKIGKEIGYTKNSTTDYFDFAETEITKKDNFVIKGYKGTEAEKYARNNDFIFVEIIDIIKPLSPELNLSNTSSGLNASWNAVSNAASYIVYYKTSSQSNWSSFSTNTTSCYIPYTQSGTLYYVQVQSIGANGVKGDYSKVKSMTYIAQPTITGLSYNGNNTLTWNNINGANKYQIARKKTGDTAYTYFTTTATSFTEKNISAGVTYTYQVRAMYETANNGTAYGAWSSSKSVETMVKPVLTLSNKSNGIRAEWNAISGAAKYIVYYRRNADSNWSSVTTYNNYYPLLGLTAGTYYAVQVQAVYNNGNGVYSSVNRLTYIPQINPALTLSNKSNGIRAEWNKISGATKYVVYYRRNSDSKWSSATTFNNYYPLLNLTAGTQYAVQVQAVFGSANGLYSSVNRLTYIPQIQTNVSLSNKSNGIRAEWDQVPGATDYIVYYKPSGAAWSSITTKNNYFAYLNTKSGTLYCVQVQPVFNGSKGLYSKVKSMTFIAQPSLSATKQSNNVKLSWNSIPGANKYQIATKKTSESNYRYITVTGTSYIDTAAKSGENEYQVRAMYATSNNGTAYGYWSNIAYVTK